MMDNETHLYEAYVSLQQIIASVNHACAIFMVNLHALLEGCTDETISVGLASMAEKFGTFFAQTDLRMGEIAQRIGYSQDLSEARKMVYAMLMSVPLETKFRLKAASLIVRQADKVDLFFSLPEGDSALWVNMLLAGEI